MNKTGFIGYGHMGSAMLGSLLSSGALSPESVVISTRTADKLKLLKERYSHIEIVQTGREVALRCQRIFICTGTSEVAGVIGEILGVVNDETHLITISGGVEISSIEAVFNGKITRLLPTLICEAGEGFTLVCHNDKVDDAGMAFITSALSKIGKVKTIQEDRFEIGGLLTSCAPALFASMLHHFGCAAVRNGGFTYEEAFEMLLYTLSGTTKLLMKTNETFEQLVNRVATKGGATEQGVCVLDSRMPCVFDEMIEQALVPHKTRMEKTHKQFNEMKAALCISKHKNL